MTDKHHVIVPKAAAWPYLANGYQHSQQTAESLLGRNWGLVSAADREDLIVLEIDQDQYEQLNSNPRRYGVRFTCNSYISKIEPCTFDVLAEEHGQAIVADATRDVMPGTVSMSDLYLTAQEAALSARAEVVSQIELHKAAIAELESFLRTHL